MPLHAGNSLKTFSLNVQSKLITKLAKKAAKGSLKRYDVMTSSSLQNLNEMYDFIKLQDCEQTAKKVIDNSVAVMCKVAVMFYNDLFSEREENLLLELFEVEKELIESFLREGELKTGNYSSILGHIRVMEEKTDTLISVRFSEKTRNRAKEFFKYFSKEEVYQFLFTDSSAEHFLSMSKTMFRESLANLECSKQFINERRNKHGRMKKLARLSKEIQTEQFAKMSAEWGKKPKDPSEDMVGQKALEALGSLQRFIVFESKDERKGEELISSILTIIAKLEAGFAADIYSDEDQTRLFDLVGTVRMVIETFLSVWDHDSKRTREKEFSRLIDLYEETEEKLCELLRPHFGGNTLTRVRSLFYYFKKPEVNLFYFKEMDDEKIRDDVARVLQQALHDIPANVLCVPTSSTIDWVAQ